MNYTLYYWNIPFRGNFPKLLLVDAEVGYEDADPMQIYPQKRPEVEFPFMAPPVLYDRTEQRYLSQMPAIMMYLAEKHDYLPREKLKQALAHKVILDCNDVLLEITNYNGQKMWEKKEWIEFRRQRLAVWLDIFEKTGVLHGLEEKNGFLFGAEISVADITLAALLGSMIHALPQLEKDVEDRAPAIHGLVKRIEQRKNIYPFLERQRQEYGDVYCGGQIEKSIRKMLG